MGKTSKDKRDIYYRLAKEEGWRARSAYKLLQLDEAYDLFHLHPDDSSSADILQLREERRQVRRVVDLCAAPGSWSQVLSRRLLPPLQQAGEKSEGIEGGGKEKAGTDGDVVIVAVDLQPMAPIRGVTQLRADITDSRTAAQICRYFSDPKDDKVMRGLEDNEHDHAGARVDDCKCDNRADLVVCDGAPDVTGLHAWDMLLQQHLVVAALSITVQVLRPGGTFVAKVFRGPDLADLIIQQLNVLFADVSVYKPAASRASSYESFVVARAFRPPPSFRPGSLLDYLQHDWRLPDLDPEGLAYDDWHRQWIPFLAQGDVYQGAGRIIAKTCTSEDDHHRGIAYLDSETTHRLDDGYQGRAPVQPPTEPPYREALALKRQARP